MQITINQTEIEAAIKAHILSQINIKEGHDISIQLKATRGDDGTTAIIDISPSAAPAPIPTTPVNRESAGLGIKETVAKAKETPQEAAKSESKPEPKAKEEKPEDPPFQPDTDAQASTDGAAAETSTAETASADEAKPQEEAAAAPRTSLFAGLKKPNNG